MALTKDLVTFDLNASAGNQVVSTSIDPKIVIFLGTRRGTVQTGHFTPSEGYSTYIGMTDGVDQYCGVLSADNPGGNDRGKARLVDDAVIDSWAPPGSAENFQASIVSLGTGQFTISVDNSPDSVRRVTALCLGGSDITSVALSDGALTGSLGATVSDTALGATPTGLLFLGIHRVSAPFPIQGTDDPGLMLGAAAPGISQHGIGVAPDGGGSGEHIARDDAVLPGCGFSGVSGGNYDDGWDVQSFDASGFTLEKVQDDAHDGHYAALAVEGVQFALDTIVSPTSPSAVSTTGLPFGPEAVIIQSADFDTVPDVAEGAKGMVGLSDGVAASAAAYTNEDADGSGTESYSESHVIRSVQIDAATVLEEAALQSLNADGATFDFTTADATTREHFAVYVGPSGDVTAPTLTSAAASDTGETTADGSVDTDTGEGTLYWVVTQSATKPTVGQIQAGENHIGQPADDSASQAVSATGTQNVSSDGLTEATQYWFHYQQEDAVGNDSAVVSASFTTHVALGLFTFVLSPGVVTVDTGSLEVRVAFPAADLPAGELPLSGLEYAVWPQASANTAQLPSAWGAPSLQGSDGEIDANREFALEVTGTFSDGDVVYLYLSDSDGTVAAFNHCGGPVTTTPA